jgi:ubiquinone/menaquinone biosynthesis C-methylase UbiE
MSDEHQHPSEDQYYILDKSEVIFDDIEVSGYILDIGGGGEGVIGQLKGDRVIAIDPNKRELEEAAEGPLKIVMDARELQFLDASFEAATSFFTLMYIPAEDHRKVFEEIYRVLEPHGRFLIWDINLPLRLDEDKDIAVIFLNIKLQYREIETGYGTKWPELTQDLAYYKKIAEQVGFTAVEQKDEGSIFFLEIQKP